MTSSSSSDAYLGISKSLNGRRWRLKECDDRAALALAQRLDVPEIVGRILSIRGVGLDEAPQFLEPTLRDLLPDPSSFLDMDVACSRVAGAIKNGEKVAVFGDYDVDGATSSALLLRLFRALGADLTLYIPDRIKEGYGPNTPALLKLKEAGVSVVITVDCGTSSFEPLEAAKKAGLDVIVLDHHKADVRLPDASAVVNPNRLDETGAYGQLAAVGLVFLFAVGLNRLLRESGFYQDKTEPNLLQWLDIVALGTVCDVVPLIGVNRALVAQGLKIMGHRANTGITALADIAGVDEAPGTYHAGFILGPRINAGGRVGASDLGARLLSTENKVEADEISKRLNELNKERQEIEARVLEEALEGVEQSGGEGANAPFILAAGKGWHPGVIGIVASRLKERYNRPACVVALDGDVGHGSARSISGIDLGAAVIAATQSGLLVKGGGHAMAAGFTVEASKLDALEKFLMERMAEGLTGIGGAPSLSLDGSLRVEAAQMSLLEDLAKLEPFGSGNAEPRFVFPNAKILRADPVGADQSHLRCTLGGDGKGRLNGIAFRCMDTDLGQALVHHDGAPFHITGRLRVNTWQGVSSPQLMIDDAAPVW
jgi:single-stranded-DNA-specific exonuclease